MIASFLTQPLEVLKTRKQTEAIIPKFSLGTFYKGSILSFIAKPTYLGMVVGSSEFIKKIYPKIDTASSLVLGNIFAVVLLNPIFVLKTFKENGSTEKLNWSNCWKGTGLTLLRSSKTLVDLYSAEKFVNKYEKKHLPIFSFLFSSVTSFLSYPLNTLTTLQRVGIKKKITFRNVYNGFMIYNIRTAVAHSITVTLYYMFKN